MANPYEHASKFSQVFFIIYPRSIAMRFAARFSNKFSFGMKSHLDLIKNIWHDHERLQDYGIVLQYISIEWSSLYNKKLINTLMDYLRLTTKSH